MEIVARAITIRMVLLVTVTKLLSLHVHIPNELLKCAVEVEI